MFGLQLILIWTSHHEHWYHRKSSLLSEFPIIIALSKNKTLIGLKYTQSLMSISLLLGASVEVVRVRANRYGAHNRTGARRETGPDLTWQWILAGVMCGRL